MNIKRIFTQDKFCELKDVWNGILMHSNNNSPFLTFEWQYNWWRHFGFNKKLFILIAVDREEINGIAPLMLENKFGFNIIKFIGTGISDDLDFIIKKDKEKIINLFIKFLKDKNSKEWDMVFLSDININLNELNNLINKVKHNKLEVNYRLYTLSPYIAVEKDWDNFIKSKSQRFRKRIRGNFNRIKKNDGLEILCLKGKEISDTLIEELCEVERKSWKYQNGTAHFDRFGIKDFYKDILDEFSAKNWIEIWLAKVNGTIVAFDINYNYDEKIYNQEGSYDLNYPSCGSFLTQIALKNAFDIGLKEFDFLRGNEKYKKLWTDNYRKLYQIVIFKKKLKSLFCFIIFIKIRWLLAKSEFLHKVLLFSIKTKGKFRNLKKLTQISFGKIYKP